MKTLTQLKEELRKHSNPDKAKVYARFFKTKKGQYGHGDMFLGLTVPETRLISKKFVELDFNGIQKLLLSKIHEERLAALFVLIEKYKKSDAKGKKEIIGMLNIYTIPELRETPELNPKLRKTINPYNCHT